MSRSPESFVASGIWRRAAAIAALAGLLLAGPLVVRALAGSPIPDLASLREAWRSGRLDDYAVVQIGAALFCVLWAWFLVTAMGEAWQVLRWRRAPRRVPLPAITPSPTGWVRHLVRVALVSTTAIAVSGLAPLHARSGAVHAAAAGRPVTAMALADPGDPWSAPAARRAAVPNVIARNRDTPYSIAARLGDPSLRDRIIELNSGRPGPDGTVWTGGVFPAGMPVDVPQGSLGRTALDADTAWAPYLVRDGDSVYAIAAELTRSDHRTVTEVADEIIRRNLGRSMPDGRVFDDPSVIVSGWVLDVPAPDAGLAAGHVVVAGDSYWRIATERLETTGGSTAPPVVASLVDELRDLNAPLLGHDDPDLIIPGELVRWADDRPVPAPAPVPAVVTVDAAPVIHVPETAEFPPPMAHTTPPAARSGVGDEVDGAGSVDEASEPVADPPPAVEAAAPAVDVVPVAGGPTDERVSPATENDGHGIPAPLGLGAAAFVCVGAVALLESRRRDQLRRATTRSEVLRPSDRLVAVETVVRSCSAADRIARLELGLRSVARPLAAAGRHVTAAIVAGDGGIHLVLDAPAAGGEVEAPWRLTGDGSLVLSADVPLADLGPSARRSAQPCPALVHLGVAVGGVHDGADVHVDLEALGLLEIAGPPEETTSILRAITTSLAVSPLSETLRGVTVGLEPTCQLGNPNLEAAPTLDAALDVAVAQLGSTGTVTGGRRTFGLRASGSDPDGESWEPVVVIAAGEVHDRDEVASLTQCGGRGLAVVLGVAAAMGSPAPGQATAGATLRCVPGVAGRPGRWHLDPLDVDLLPVGVGAQQVTVLDELLTAAADPLPDGAPLPSPSSPRVVVPERPWALRVRLLGQVSVEASDGSTATFGRSKALELTAWLALHRDRPTRTAARTALWELDVRPETFANVVSDARRSLARCTPPPEGSEWIERTLTEHLPLHPLVVTDADLVRDALDRATALDGDERSAVLRDAVELVAGPPFAGSDYLWPHAEGITSSLLLLATRAATELARCCLELGDIDGVFWATGRGLQVVPGHEELIALRMRAHAQRGDLAGVRTEWEVYERALHADPWSAGEPSPKLASVRRELLSP